MTGYLLCENTLHKDPPECGMIVDTEKCRSVEHFEKDNYFCDKCFSSQNKLSRK